MTLQLYVLKQIFRTFILILLVLLVVGIVIGIYQAGRFHRTTDVVFLSTILLITIPDIIAVIIPISALLSGVLVFGKLSATNELDGAKSCGISLSRIQITAVLMGLICVFVMWIFEDDIIPECKYQRRNIGRTMLKTILKSGQGGLNEVKLGDIKFVYNNVNNGVLQNVHLVKLYGGKPVVEYFAKEVVITLDENRGIFFLELRDARRFVYSKNDKNESEKNEMSTPYREKTYSFSEISVERIDLSREVSQRQRKLEESSSEYMISEVSKKKLGISTIYTEEQVFREITKRISSSLSPLFLILIGSVIGIKARLRTLVSGIGYGFLPVFIGYFSLSKGFEAISKNKGIIEALFLIVPNLLCVIVFIILYKKVLKD